MFACRASDWLALASQLVVARTTSAGALGFQISLLAWWRLAIADGAPRVRPERVRANAITEIHLYESINGAGNAVDGGWKVCLLCDHVDLTIWNFSKSKSLAEAL